MNPFRKYVLEHARLFKHGLRLPLNKSGPAKRPKRIPSHAPSALIFSPHPDDECIVGGLAFVSFLVFAARFGIDMGLPFELAVITIVWIGLIPVGILSALWFLRVVKN